MPAIACFSQDTILGHHHPIKADFKLLVAAYSRDRFHFYIRSPGIHYKQGDSVLRSFALCGSARYKNIVSDMGISNKELMPLENIICPLQHCTKFHLRSFIFA